MLSFDALSGPLALAAERRARLFAKMSPATKVTMRLLKLGPFNDFLLFLGVFVFSSLPGETINLDEYIFYMFQIKWVETTN